MLSDTCLCGADTTEDRVYAGEASKTSCAERVKDEDDSFDYNAVRVLCG
ncbi:MAG: hypothetical protein ACFFAZ_11600 [Promethearchaeota archaeon]